MSLSEFRCILKECISYFYNMALSLIFGCSMYIRTTDNLSASIYTAKLLNFSGVHEFYLMTFDHIFAHGKVPFPPKDRTCLLLRQTHTRGTNQ